MPIAIFRLAGRSAIRAAHYASRAVHAITPRWLRAVHAAIADLAGLAGMFIITRRLGRIIRAVMPGWMLAAFAVCLAIPGPFDEMAMLAAGVILAGVRFRRTCSAWRGGKSHRAHDLAVR